MLPKITTSTMLAYLQSIFEEPWKSVSRLAVAAWLVFYVGFLAYAFGEQGGFLFIDSANLVVHEGGHNQFGWFGPTLGLWGEPCCSGWWRFFLPRIFICSGKGQRSSTARSSCLSTVSTRRLA